MAHEQEPMPKADKVVDHLRKVPSLVELCDETETQISRCLYKPAPPMKMQDKDDLTHVRSSGSVCGASGVKPCAV
jgi:hypothetical protein